jgi:aspartate kinase
MHTAVASRMFGALATRGINISTINTSEVRVSVVVDGSRGEEALACLRASFGFPERTRLTQHRDDKNAQEEAVQTSDVTTG